jgi:cell wall-associated NlpC family hydrolase
VDDIAMLTLLACHGLTACCQATVRRCYRAPAMQKPLFTALFATLALLNTAGCMHGAPPASTTTPNDEKALMPRLRDGASDLVLSAMNYLGVSYTPGGNNADQGFDCSGFTRFIFENSLGLVLPRRAEDQASHAALHQVKAEALRPGDLVFFNTTKRAFSHVGIYVGEGRFIHAPRVGGEVRIEDMRLAYWSQRFDGARRAPDRVNPVP